MREDIILCTFISVSVFMILASARPPSSPSSPSAITYAARSGLVRTRFGIPITSMDAARTPRFQVNVSFFLFGFNCLFLVHRRLGWDI